MKKTALTLVLALLFSVVAGTQLLGIGRGNPILVMDGFVSPAISILSPQNNTSYLNQVPLIFVTITGGFPPENPLSDHGPWAFSYSYSMDDQGAVGVTENMTLTGLSAGNHFIVMNITYYMSRTRFCGNSSELVYFDVEVSEPFPSPTPTSTSTLTPSSTPSISPSLSPSPTETPSPSPTTKESPSPTPSPTSNQTFGPNQSPEPQPEPFPTTLVIASVSIVAVVCIGSIVYFKKLRK